MGWCVKGGVIAAVVTMPLTSGAATAADKHIAIATLVEHPALDRAMKGVQDGLRDAGLTPEKGYRIEVQSAQGSPVTAGQIARKFAGDKPDAIVALSTPVAQAMVAAIRDTPIVFSAISDPLAAKLVDNVEKPGRNVTGTSDSAPLGPLLTLIGEIVPDIQAMGIVYNAGEANSRAQVDRLKRESGDRNWRHVAAIVTKPTDVAGALQNLVGKVQAIYVPNDNTVVSTFEVVHRFSAETRLPVFATDTLNVDRGALAAVGVDYYDSGRIAADMVRRILAGEKPGDIPVALPQNPDVAINAKVARELGITIPPAALARAKRIVE